MDAVHASVPGAFMTDGPSTLELASQVGARKSRVGSALLLLLYIALFAGAAWGTFTYLATRAAADLSTLTLGTPRLVRGGESQAPGTATEAKTPRPRPRVTPRKKSAGKRASRVETARPASGGGTPDPTPSREAQPPKVDDHESTEEPAKPSPDVAPPAKPAPAKEPPVRPASPAENMEQFRASLNADSVRMVIKHYLPQLRVCYERASKKGAFGGGVVDIQFTVSSEGKVSIARVVRNSTGSKDLGSCIAAAFKRWRFPRPVGGEMEFIYPFVFASGG